MIDDALNVVDGRPIPDLEGLHNKFELPRHPRLDAMCFLSDPESRVPRAAVCLNDCYHTLAEARYALLQGFRQLEHYRGKEPPSEPSAVFFGQFYGSDAALRLYSAGEHLANAIIEALDIPPSLLSLYQKNRISLQGVVAEFLSKGNPSHVIATAVGKLGTSDEWKQAVKYRNLWVHEQAPPLAGMGLVFKRGKDYWQKVGSKDYQLGIGGGDKPDQSVDDLLELVRAASCLFTDVLVVVLEHYMNLLAQAAARSSDESGIMINPS